MTVRFENAAGEEITCEEAGVPFISISIGAAPMTQECSMAQNSSYGNLLPGRYPVVIELLGESGLVLEEHIGNAVVGAGQSVRYEHTFQVEDIGAPAGTLELSWFVDGRSPAQGCLLAGAETVFFQLLGGPGDDLMVERACTEGQTTFVDIRSGAYVADIRLRDAAGGPLGLPTIERSVVIPRNGTLRLSLDILSRLPERGDLLALWTVNGTVAASGCAAVPRSAVELSVRTDEAVPLDVATATAPCSAGGIAVDGILIDGTTESLGFRVTYQLTDTSTFGGVVDLETLREVRLTPATTTTVTVDLEAPPR